MKRVVLFICLFANIIGSSDAGGVISLGNQLNLLSGLETGFATQDKEEIRSEFQKLANEADKLSSIDKKTIISTQFEKIYNIIGDLKSVLDKIKKNKLLSDSNLKERIFLYINNLIAKIRPDNYEDSLKILNNIINTKKLNISSVNLIHAIFLFFTEEINNAISKKDTKRYKELMENGEKLKNYLDNNSKEFGEFLNKDAIKEFLSSMEQLKRPQKEEINKEISEILSKLPSTVFADIQGERKNVAKLFDYIQELLSKLALNKGELDDKTLSNKDKLFKVEQIINLNKIIKNILDGLRSKGYIDQYKPKVVDELGQTINSTYLAITDRLTKLDRTLAEVYFIQFTRENLDNYKNNKIDQTNFKEILKLFLVWLDSRIEENLDFASKALNFSPSQLTEAIKELKEDLDSINKYLGGDFAEYIKEINKDVFGVDISRLLQNVTSRKRQLDRDAESLEAMADFRGQTSGSDLIPKVKITKAVVDALKIKLDDSEARDLANRGEIALESLRVLGFDRNNEPTAQEERSAHKKLMLKWSPDKAKNTDLANEVSQKLSEVHKNLEGKLINLIDLKQDIQNILKIKLSQSELQTLNEDGGVKIHPLRILGFDPNKKPTAQEELRRYNELVGKNFNEEVKKVIIAAHSALAGKLK